MTMSTEMMLLYLQPSHFSSGDHLKMISDMNVHKLYSGCAPSMALFRTISLIHDIYYRNKASQCRLLFTWRSLFIVQSRGWFPPADDRNRIYANMKQTYYISHMRTQNLHAEITQKRTSIVGCCDVQWWVHRK